MKRTAKQARFIEGYVICLNGTKAAIAAGRSAKTARAIASESLGKPSIQTAIANQERLRETRLSAERDYVIQELAEIVDFNIFELFGKNGAALPIFRWPAVSTSFIGALRTPSTG